MICGKGSGKDVFSRITQTINANVSTVAACVAFVMMMMCHSIEAESQ